MQIFAETSLAYTPESGTINGTFGSYFYKTNFAGSPTGETSPWLTGFSIVATGDINAKSSLEVGMLYYDQIFFRDQSGLFVAEKTQMLHVTMGYRYWLTPYLSSSLSLYTGYPMGDSSLTHSDFPQNQQIDTSASDTTTTGLDFAIQEQVWESGKFGIVLDERYSWALTKKSSEYSDVYGVTVGVRYLIQEKESFKKEEARKEAEEKKP